MGFPSTGERKSFGENGVKRGGFSDRGRGGNRNGRGGFSDRGRGGFSDRGRGGFGGRGSDRGRGGQRGRGGRGGGRDSARMTVEPIDGIAGVYRYKNEILTRNLTNGETVYGEKKVSVPCEVEPGKKIEYRVWNPYRSKIGAAITLGIDDLYIHEGSKVLYLGAANGTTVSHVSDMVGPKGIVYAVEFSKRSGRDLENMSTNRPNIIPIIHDARVPAVYRLIVGSVDMIFADVAQPDQSRIVSMNAEMFLKKGGHVVLTIKAACVDSSANPESVYLSEIDTLKKLNIKPLSQLDLGDFSRGHAIVTGQYLPV